MRFQSTKGFTLIETLVAVAILMLALAGPLTIATKGLTTSVYSRDQLVASYLGQEAIEFVRNTRDENVLKEGAGQWLAGGSTGVDLSDCMGSSVCRIDVFAPTQAGWVQACPSAGCPALNYDSTNNYYTYGSGSASIFTRSVTIRPGSHADEVRVTATVTWSSGIFTRSLSIEEYLSNWLAPLTS